MNYAVLIPALDPSSELVSYVRDLQAAGFERILVVNDGSQPACSGVFDTLRSQGATVVDHEINHGKGAACKTGIAFARNLWPGIAGVITADADGQHLVRDVVRMAKAAEAHAGALVLGVRDFSGPEVPKRSRLGNAVSALSFRLSTGRELSDTQTGLRVLPASLFDAALNCTGERYDWEMRFLEDCAAADVPLHTLPIETVYLNNNAASHFHPVLDSLSVMRPMLRFAAASLLCAALDLGLFALFCALLPAEALSVLVATLAARIVSGVANFVLNRRWSFRAAGQGSAAGQALRYAALCFAQASASAVFAYLLTAAGMPAIPAKLFVDGALFVVSFMLQRLWVFGRTKQLPISSQPSYL